MGGMIPLKSFPLILETPFWPKRMMWMRRSGDSSCQNEEAIRSGAEGLPLPS